MSKKWIAWINLVMACVTGVFFVSAAYLTFARPSHFPKEDLPLRKLEMPKGAFSSRLGELDLNKSPSLALKFTPLGLQLPDLRKYLVYYGKNGRPDATEGPVMLHFAFTGNKNVTSIPSGKRLYISYDKTVNPNQYIFSPQNKDTFLWIEPIQQGNQALVHVAMRDDKGNLVKEPESYAEFLLPEKEFPRFGGSSWELGKWKVDGTLLARQKARWFGLDRFLERYGGNEYDSYKNKQRIDFGEGDELYSVYVGLEDCLVWKDDRWQMVKPGDPSSAYPLMCAKKIDDRIINFDLWDIGGKGKISLNLLKSNETWAPQNVEQNFKFLGARTRSQYVFEIDKERILLSPHDWLLHTENGWKKLSTSQDIDNYVERKTIGTLFVFDGIGRKEDRQVIEGTLFNPSRTEISSVEIPTHQSQQGQPGTIPISPQNPGIKKTKDRKIAPVLKSQQTSEERDDEE